MGPSRYTCEGVSVEGLWIPPFQLHQREAVCLHLPPVETWQEREQLVDALVGRRPLRGLTRSGRTLHAALPRGPGGLRGLWPQPGAADWLRRRGGISMEEARRIVARLGLREQWRISHLACNPRTLLGLEAAYARGADVIVFSTEGCDPLGTKTVFETVSARLDQASVIYLSYPYRVNGKLQRSCLPGARCVEVARQEELTSASSPARR